MRRAAPGARMAHLLGDAQWAYNDWLAHASGPDVAPLPAWREQMYNITGECKRAAQDGYRDCATYPPRLLAEVEADVQRQARALVAARA